MFESNFHTELEPKKQLDIFWDFLHAEGFPERKKKIALSILDQLHPKGELPTFGPITDRKHQVRVRGDSRSMEGQIPGCITTGCAGACCDVKPGNANTITMSLEEWRVATVASQERKGPRADHLSVVNNLGQRLLLACRNGINDCSGCGPAHGVDPGYVPEDCSIYPFLVDLDPMGMTVRSWVATRGSNIDKVKCPLPAADALLHLPWAFNLAIDRIKEDISHLVGAIDSIKEMVGYTRLDLAPFLRLSHKEVETMMKAAVKYSKERTIKISLKNGGVKLVKNLPNESKDGLGWAIKATEQKGSQALSLTEKFLSELATTLSDPIKPIENKKNKVKLLL